MGVINESIVACDHACAALMAYEEAAQARDEAMYEQYVDPKHGHKMNGRRLNTPALPVVKMSDYSRLFGAPIEEMKKHWKCVELKYGK